MQISKLSSNVLTLEAFKKPITEDKFINTKANNFANMLVADDNEKDGTTVNNAIPSSNYTKYTSAIKKPEGAPYSHLADDNGIINHNGVIFVCDNDNRTLCLGDMSKKDNILTIPLSEGGTLKVNRNSLTDLANSIDMFSPEDTKRIMFAISIDAKTRKTEMENEKDEAKAFMELVGN